MFDADDLKILAGGAVLLLAFLVTIVFFAVAVGLAWNVFELVRGV